MTRINYIVSFIVLAAMWPTFAASQSRPLSLTARLIPPAEVKWIRMPNAREMARAYPERAARLQVTGMARLNCLVGDTGGLRDCTTSDEKPAGYDFGAAALQVAPIFQADLMTKTGEPSSGRSVSLWMRFSTGQ